MRQSGQSGRVVQLFSRRLTLATVAASLVWLAIAPIVRADFGFDAYTYGSSVCSPYGIKDPLNFYYGKTLGWLPTAVQKTEEILSWRSTAFSSDQWFRDSGMCQVQGAQRNDGTTDRNHTRLNQGDQRDPQWTFITSSPMHYERTNILCGHVSVSFNSPRDYAAQKYQQSGYFAVYSWAGNTALLTQCDGSQVRSDGYYVLARD